MANQQELESAIVRRIMRNLAATGGWFMKVHGGAFQVAGVPDIIGCLKGRFVAFEVKRPGGKATKLQLHTIGLIQKAGGLAAVVYSWDDARRALEGGGDG